MVTAPAAAPVITVVTASTAAPAAAPPPVTGFTTVFGVSVNPMVIVLAIALAVLLIMFWRAQRDAKNPFDITDLFMEAGHASVTKLLFMATWGMTTWAVVDNEIKHTLTDAIFGLYLAAWVTPLVAKVVFNKESPPELPGHGGERKEGC